MDQETNDRITKQFLKQLPIWDNLNEFSVQVEQLNFHINDQVDRLNDLCNRIDKLPTVSHAIESQSPIENGKEIIKICKRDTATGEWDVTTKPDKTLPLEPQLKESPSFLSSLRRLEEPPTESEEVYAMFKLGEPWKRCKIKHVQHKKLENMRTTRFRLQMLEDPNKTLEVNKFAVARIQNHGVALRACKRVIADLMPGIIGQDPCDENKQRYLVLMDDGSARYYEPNQVYPIYFQSTFPWDDARCLGGGSQFLKADLTYFFRCYPTRKIVKVKPGDKITIHRNGLAVPACVTKLDYDTMKIVYKDRTHEWVYRGSARLSFRDNFISDILSKNFNYDKMFDKLVGLIRQYHAAGETALGGNLRFVEDFEKLVICGRAPTARKSTARPTLQVNLQAKPVADDRVTCPEVQELINQFADHKKCDPDCLNVPGIKTEKSVHDIIAEFRHVSDLKVPLLLGWKRLLVRGTRRGLAYVYQAPCGKVFNQAYLIRRYLQNTGSKLDVDYFTFDRDVDLNRTVNEYTAYYYKENLAVHKDTKVPLENKFVSVMNHINEEQLPVDFEYHNKTFPHPMLKAKNFSFNLEFKSGCECEDDCQTRASCACHRLIEEAFGTNAHHKGQVHSKCQYKEKRLASQVSTGIFECNSFCSCSSKCLNRVVQNGIRFRLQVRRTLRRGFGIFTLDDIPAGAFIATYSAELLDDADQYGDCDMYFADLDYISVVEEQKTQLDDEDEGVEDVDDEDLKEDRPRKRKVIAESSDDDDFTDADEYMPNGVGKQKSSSSSSSSSARATANRYPKRNARAHSPRPTAGQSNGTNNRQRYRNLHEILGETSDYTLDARMQGNIGRFFNHSCDPNAFVQNVFIESHDLRFPEVAFFAKRSISADDEITWNYNYKMGSIEGRIIECTCGAPNCSGRIL